MIYIGHLQVEESELMQHGLSRLDSPHTPDRSEQSGSAEIKYHNMHDQYYIEIVLVASCSWILP